MRVSETVAIPNLCLLPVKQSFIEHQCIMTKDKYAFLTMNTGFQVQSKILCRIIQNSNRNNVHVYLKPNKVV